MKKQNEECIENDIRKYGLNGFVYAMHRMEEKLDLIIVALSNKNGGKQK